MLERAYEKAAAHERLTYDEGVALLERGDFHVLTALAHKRRMHMHPEPVVTPDDVYPPIGVSHQFGFL